MTEQIDNYHFVKKKRLVLIVDDEEINREILGNILKDDYEIIYAASGAEAIEKVVHNKDTLSLMLLDLIMPDMNGMDVLRLMKREPELSNIPVIVITSDKTSEVESLTMGAEFVPKPFPDPGVIMARVRRTIELSEDRDIIKWTERDQLTGLYNKEYFYRYADQYDQFHKEQAMDAIVVDINHFRMINERYGKLYGDEVLKRVGGKVKEMVRESGGIVCRRESDTFLIYCPHRSDYTDILENAGLAGEDGVEGRIRLRMGIYSEVDKTIDIERRFDRAKLAADTVRSNFTKAIAIYDNALHESEIFAEQLLDDFDDALKTHQFEVYYQPKFDIRMHLPVLSSAEALVRWKHPDLGMISPGVFIPLFEGNGLIPKLDSYVWREVAAQLKKWKDEIGIAVPVSVNVSRVDMYDQDMVENMMGLVNEFGLDSSMVLLEITESAYTQDSEQIIKTVNELRQKGFKVEMDDFGTGYSSLNMISTLPIDALKLDIQFIRNAFSERKDTRMLEVIIDIADSLGVPTIAEGVETAEQMLTLKAMGCDIVQGYYFSRPVPACEYEEFLKVRKTEKENEIPDRNVMERYPRERIEKTHEKFAYDALHDPVTGLYNHSGFDMLFKDTDKDHIALLIASIDDYRLIKDTNGDAAADKVARFVADVMRQNFRSVDLICRLSGDEFVVIMSRVNSSMQSLIFDKIEQINTILQTPGEDALPVSLSVGMAFSDRENPQGDIFEDADTALFRMKEVRRCGCAVF